MATHEASGGTLEYTFTLKYRLAADDRDQGGLVERFGAAGCDDALIGIGQPGRIALEFTRDAVSAETAVLSALEDVRRVIPAAELVEAVPDYVGLTDVADVVGVSRQNMRKLAVHHSANFPRPVHEGSAAIWHLADVLSWLKAKGAYDIDPALLEVAAATMQVNLALQGQRLVPRMRREVRGRAW